MKKELTRERFELLERDIERYLSALHQLEGKINHLQSELKESFDCGTIKQAKNKLAVLKKKLERDEIEFHKKLHQFEKTWLREIEALQEED